MDITEVLRTIPFFASVLTSDKMAALAGQLRLVTFIEGAVLMWQADAGSSMFAIVDGEARVTARDRNGDDVEVAVLRAGDIVGEMSLLTGARRRATVLATSRVTALEIGKEALEPLLAASPGLVHRFAEVMEERQAALDRAYDSAGHWNILGLGREQVATLIGSFFKHRS